MANPIPVTTRGTITPFNPIAAYRDMKNKFKLAQDDCMYTFYIESVVSQMFEWDEKIYRAEFFDKMLRDCGMAALIKTDTSDYTPVWFTPVDLGNGRYADGWFKDCKCYDFRGKDYDFKDWENNPEILVFFNTPLRTPDLFVEKFANMLSDVDFSIINNVHYSRQHPVPVAKDTKTKSRLDKCIKDVSNGDFNTVVMEASIADVLDGADSIQMLNLTDVTKSEYIQYLSHLHDSLTSRLFFHIGLGTVDNGKQAQISVEELNKNDDASVTMALAWHRARQDAIDVAREKGHELSFDFSPLWKNRIDRIINPPEMESTPKEQQDEESQEDEVKEDESE